jgi:acetyl esterase/lipase
VVSRSYRRGAYRALLGLALATFAGPIAACGTSAEGSSAAVSSTAPQSANVIGSPPGVLVEEYLPGLPAQLRFPTADGPAPLIVMVPGGGWSSADPAGLIPLAGRLTDEGASTALITYATTGEGSTFPEAVDDVACAVRWSAQQATSHGHGPTHVILLGHSAGGHLASLVTFSGQEFGRECPAPPVSIDGLIGLAGVYDTDPFRAYLSGWMGVSPTEAPDTWRRANPIEWLRRGPEVRSGLRVLLIHGDADESVPLQQTTAMGDALASARIDSQTSVLPGLGHLEIFEASHAGPPILSWMKAWPGAVTGSVTQGHRRPEATTPSKTRSSSAS